MNVSKYVPGARRMRFSAASVAALAALFSAGLLVALVGGAQAASAPVPLGTADSFVVLAGAGITNTGPTTLKGDIGTIPDNDDHRNLDADRDRNQPRRRRRHPAGQDRPRYRLQHRRQRGADFPEVGGDRVGLCSDLLC